MKTLELLPGFRVIRDDAGNVMISMTPQTAPKEWGGEWPKHGIPVDCALTPDHLQTLSDFIKLN